MELGWCDFASGSFFHGRRSVAARHLYSVAARHLYVGRRVNGFRPYGPNLRRGPSATWSRNSGPWPKGAAFRMHDVNWRRRRLVFDEHGLQSASRRLRLHLIRHDPGKPQIVDRRIERRCRGVHHQPRRDSYGNDAAWTVERPAIRNGCDGCPGRLVMAIPHADVSSDPGPDRSRWIAVPSLKPGSACRGGSRRAAEEPTDDQP